MQYMINIGIIGTGNCACSLYQGLHYYKNKSGDGLMRELIGTYSINDIRVVCAFDIDKRKVGQPLGKAIFEKPNCTPQFVKVVQDGPIVNMGNVLDGVTPLMEEYPEDDRFCIADNDVSNIVQILKDTKVDILINYLPVGSQKATEFYAECCLDAHVAFLNCIPIFIASDPVWEQKFIDKGIPLIGDDMKSQFGASILSQVLQELAIKRGHHVKCHIQRNIGGNTDFLNMTDITRVKSKKISKENVIRHHSTENTFIHAGPSEYISYHKDNKIANIHMELEGFMGSPVILNAELSVIDSPNSAGVIIDAIRYLKIAKDIGMKGSIRGPSAFTQKTPPLQMTLEESIIECDKLSELGLKVIDKPNK